MTQDTANRLGILRPIDQTELPLMLSWRNAPAVRVNMYTTHEISLTEHMAWWDRIKNRADQQYFMYEYQGSPAGIVAFNGIDINNLHSSWAFYASPEATKGTGSRMEYLALTHAFDVLKLHKICCEVLAFNMPVVKLHEKFGFKIEGILREQHKIETGFVDIYRLGMLSTEWALKRDQMLAKLLDFQTFKEKP
ncbi:UDP-4-amino-4,6-dideoxy-N-acetyl-beta-L-altrosamine N-acetyltransferase [Vogesella sp. DC21W]|uniref:UDP-4-amino-4, 6-dideoxy-N-acetyl-beta-L-altrosamine N-acetyltransferase n=1 Tax=Vogesella aquatica TaxID=2984206 RepID=A0ABT5IWR7_9NEIS|nr:UDP-4-amino-4,6-dideoxy-N-acetyl-beta-L-altrosamine N-acetyltransferase [Vogesella aquatica]MDC7716942.1 UDP-4-amino-4,6-dideoxy-N-acetyl-beta-L-altrosamine N-acetyltransferase [Vogesella aquatica]